MEDLPNIFSKADVVLVPSVGENYPFVIREAFHACVPVIASELSGIPEIVQDGVNGLLFNPGDANQLAEKIRQLVEDKSLLNRLKTNILPVRTMEEDAREWLYIYYDLINKQQSKQLAKKTINKKCSLIIPLLDDLESVCLIGNLIEKVFDDEFNVLIADINDVNKIVSGWNKAVESSQDEYLMFFSLDITTKSMSNIKKMLDFIQEKNIELMGAKIFCENVRANKTTGFMNRYKAQVEVLFDGVLLIKKNDFIKFGKFNEQFKNPLIACIDLSLRIKRQGGNLSFMDDVEFIAQDCNEKIYNNDQFKMLNDSWGKDFRQECVKFGYIFYQNNVFREQDLLNRAKELESKRNFKGAMKIYINILKGKPIRELIMRKALLELQQLLIKTGNKKEADKLEQKLSEKKAFCLQEK